MHYSEGKFSVNLLICRAGITSHIVNIYYIWVPEEPPPQDWKSEDADILSNPFLQLLTSIEINK
jgi:hypothetical protein